MPINRFDTSIGQRYVSTYVPLPFEELAYIAKRHQDKEDSTLEDVAKTQSLIKINADPKNEIVRDKLISKYNNELTNIANDMVERGVNHENMLKFNNIKNQFINDPNRLQLEKSYENYYKKYQPDLDAAKKDRKYWEGYDPYLTTPGSEDKVTPFDYKGMNTKGNYIPDMQSLIDQIKSDSSASEGYKKDKQGNLVINSLGQLQKSNGSWENITESKVWNLAKTLAPTFFRTKDAQWFIDERASKPYKSYSEMNDDEKKLFEEEATKELFRIGSPQIFSKKESGIDLQNLSEHALKKTEENQYDPWESTYSKMGEQNVKGLSESEPSTSLLSKIINFVNPKEQASNLLTWASFISPSVGGNIAITNLKNKLDASSEKDKFTLDKTISEVGSKMKQAIGKDQGNFIKENGFRNPIYESAYSLVNMFTSHKENKESEDYLRAKNILSSIDPKFSSLNKEDQFKAIVKAKEDYENTSRTNVVLVPMDKDELKFKNEQIAAFLRQGDIDGAKAQMINTGLTSNGKFIDYQTGKEETLENVLENSKYLTYAGKLATNNQFGPGLNYFQTESGKFYVSPGSLKQQADDYLDWNLQQYNNKFLKEHEFPIDFNQRRTGIDEEGNVKSNVPRIKISENPNNHEITATIKGFSTEHTVKGKTTEEIRNKLAEIFNK